MSGWLVLPLLLVGTSSAVDLDAHACAALDAAAFEQTLALELADVAPRLRERAIRIELACEGETALILLHDGISDLRARRAVPLGDRVDSEALALTVVALIDAAWRALVALDQARLTELDPELARLIRARVARRTAPEGPSPGLVYAGAGAQARVRDLESPYASFGASLGAGIVLDLLRVGLEVSIDTGRSERRAGVVEALLVTTDVVGALELARTGPIGWSLELAIGVAWAQLSASSPLVGARVGRLEGAGLDLRIGVVARGGWAPLEVALSLSVGATPFAPRAGVVDEAPVSPGGPWAGGALTVGLR